jgi:endonuclease/exonuclease/phosphatase (EEP) superfamily protein YafD
MADGYGLDILTEDVETLFEPSAVSSQGRRADTVIRIVMTVIVGWCAFIATLRLTGTDAFPVLIGLVGLTPFVMLPIWLAAPLALFHWRVGSGRRAGWIAAVAVLCWAQFTWAGDGWKVPGLNVRSIEAADISEVNVDELTLATGNLLEDNPTPELFMEGVLEADPDVILLQELVPEAWQAISKLPEMEQYRYQIVDPQATGLGSAILSKSPLRNGGVVGGKVFRWTMAEVLWPGGQWVTIVNVHTKSPLDQLSIKRWKSELASLAEQAATAKGPLVLAGDFNATVHHDDFRALLAAGMVDAHQSVGRGLGLTWSLGGLPLLGLDHILIGGGLEALDSSTLDGTGSDHDVTVARLALVGET